MPWIPIVPIPNAPKQTSQQDNNQKHDLSHASSDVAEECRKNQSRNESTSSSKYFPWSKKATVVDSENAHNKHEPEKRAITKSDPSASMSTSKFSTSITKVADPKSTQAFLHISIQEEEKQERQPGPTSMDESKHVGENSEKQSRIKQSIVTESIPPATTIPDDRGDQNSRGSLLPTFDRDKAPPQTKSLGKLMVDVVGVAFYKQAASSARSEGAQIHLYDFMAIRAMLQEDSGQIGHIPRSVAQASLTTSSAAKGKVPKTIPISIEIFDRSNGSIPPALEASMIQLRTALGHTATTTTVSAASAKKMRVNKTDYPSLLSSSVSCEERSEHAKVMNQSTGKMCPSTMPAQHAQPTGPLGWSERPAEDKKHYAAESFELIELPLPKLSFHLPSSVDVHGLLMKAELRPPNHRHLYHELFKPKMSDTNVEIPKDWASAELFKALNEIIEDNQAYFDMLHLDEMAAEQREYGIRIKDQVARRVASSKAADRVQKVHDLLSIERQKKKCGMSIIDLAHLKQQGLHLTEDEAVDQDLLLPCIDATLLKFLQ